MASSDYLDIQRRKIPGAGTNGQLQIYDDGTESYIAIKFLVSATVARGTVVCFDQANNQRVLPVPTAGNTHDMAIGVATGAATAGNPVWVAIIGLVYVLPDLLITAIKGDVITTSVTTAGRVAQAATVPAAAVHFDEVGHWFEDGSGNGALARAIIHFN